MEHPDARALFRRLSPAVFWLEVTDAAGGTGIGSAFHIGNGVFVTARHVVEGGVRRMGTSLSTADIRSIGQPVFHPHDDFDVAVFEVPGLKAQSIPLAGSDRAGSELVLEPVLVMGYPRIPLATDPPSIVVATAEVNAVIDLYLGQQPTIVLSSTARGGFSGGAVITRSGEALGVLNRSLIEGTEPAQLGFLSATRTEAIEVCLHISGFQDVLPERESEATLGVERGD